jgi:hypothetical protein
MTLLEVKAGQTINSDMAGGLGKIGELFAGTGQSTVRVVVYGGTEKQVRNGVTYLPWREIQKQAWGG